MPLRGKAVREWRVAHPAARFRAYFAYACLLAVAANAVPRTLEPRGVRLDLTTENGVETLPVRVESGAPVRATFDLGNGSQVLISTSLAARMGLLTDGRRVSTERGGGLGGEAVRQIISLRSIDLAGRRFTDVSAAIDPQPSASDVNIGVTILRRFLITTDFAGHAVWLAPRESIRYSLCTRPLG
jgi:hypothetical protein